MSTPAEPRLYGPYGYLNGCRALTEDTWVLQDDPIENNDEYFSIPLFAKVDIAYPVSIAAPAPQPVSVKVLEWDPYRAETPFGWYEINDQRDVPDSELKGRPRFLLCGSRMDYSRHETLAAARAAAQADYAERIRSALHSTSGNDPIQGLVDACHAMAGDYQTSDTHHPEHVLVPIGAFEAMRSALSSPVEGGTDKGEPIACPCTTFEQGEDCPVGYPSLLCSACEVKGIATMETVAALAAEMLKVAEQVDELEDPFAAWESIQLLKSTQRAFDQRTDKLLELVEENGLLKGQAAANEQALASYAREIESLRVENETLRKIISDCAASLPNGAFIGTACSLEFMQELPKEISLVCAALQQQGEGK
ncbi:hypothetical protein [Rhizobium sp. SYY.PMSO]|uniref:hypothetical protein n=1 Tax=Rhizobium sp. SYY.PMSO TaxID=3382192 RepID=UPI0039900A37